MGIFFAYYFCGYFVSIKTSLVKLYIVCTLALLAISCTTECKNTNPIFDKNLPASKTYQEELIRQLSSNGNEDPDFHLENYVEREGETFLYVTVKGANLCATAVVKVMHWDAELEEIHRTKGKGYQGAGLKNLKFDIVRDSTTTLLVYKDVDYIVD